VARSQEIDWRRQQLQEAKATQAKLESQLNRSAAHYPRVSPGHEELLKQVNEAREAVPKARRRSAPARWHVKRPKNHQQQAIPPRHSRPQHSCVQPGGPGLPGYQPDVYRPIPANPRQSLAMRYDFRPTLPRQLIKNTTWPEVYIHSKLLIIDDHFVSNGSANLNMRSMQTDSELNILCANPQVARSFRQRLWRQHTRNHFTGVVRGAQDDPDEAFAAWALDQENKDAQSKHQRPEASLVGLLRSSPEIKDQD
jgi:phosphatidylserine/phosphatidylglycerophosphate/cardiolipin synthase-like enzyme